MSRLKAGAVCLAVLAAFAVAGTCGDGLDEDARRYPPKRQYQEDDPQWDCDVHGNRVCGPPRA